ncbi:MAG: sulfatase [Acidobacteria bacterium]|nr:MAG: sulfatase [Acidobacteriota bacterium]
MPPLSRRQVLMAVPAALCSFGLARNQNNPPAGTRPNIVFILADDLGWADVGCNGARFYHTPNIDRLATQGIRFTHAYAAAAVCSPTRASIMTGRYPARLGLTDWIVARFQRPERPDPAVNPAGYVTVPGRKLSCPENPFWMELDEVTIAETLRAAGYVTCHIGKWHLGSDNWYPEKQGFVINIGGCDYGQPPSYFDPYVNQRQRGRGGIYNLPPRKPGEYLTDREADEAVKFIGEHKDRPFFLHLAHYAVHTPLEAKEEVTKQYDAWRMEGRFRPVYAAMMESLDQAVGRVLSALDEAGLSENTLVVFTSDNGGRLGSTSNAPLRSGKGYPYEGGIREPLVLRWPGVIQAGTTSAAPVCSIDFFPTFCAATGTPLPSDRAIDGISLLDHLRLVEAAPLRRPALYWHFPHYRNPDIVPFSVIRAGYWKLIKRYEGKKFELFHLEDDPYEQYDLSEQAPDKVRELNQQLEEWLQAVGARLPKEI